MRKIEVLFLIEIKSLIFTHYSIKIIIYYKNHIKLTVYTIQLRRIQKTYLIQ